MPLLLTTKLSKNKTPQSQHLANFAVTTYGLKQNRLKIDAASNHDSMTATAKCLVTFLPEADPPKRATCFVKREEESYRPHF